MKKFAVLAVVLASAAILFSGCASIKIYAPDGSEKNVSKRDAWKYVRPKQEMEAKYKNIRCEFIDQAGASKKTELLALRAARIDVARMGGNAYEIDEDKSSQSFQREFIPWLAGTVHQIQLKAYLCLLPSVDPQKFS